MDVERACYSESFRVRAYEVDVAGRASAVAVCNWLQEVAGNHATALGWAVDQLADQGLTWVLARLHVKLDRPASWREEIRITTWPAGVHRVYALREFRIRSAGGGEIGAATTAWLLVNAASRRPVRPAAAIAEVARYTPGRAIADPFDKLAELATVERETILQVRQADLDINRHANNVSVLSWALEGLDSETILHPLRELEIEFRAESRYGERIASQAQLVEEQPCTFIHRLLRQEDGRELARARSVWATP